MLNREHTTLTNREIIVEELQSMSTAQRHEQMDRQTDDLP